MPLSETSMAAPEGRKRIEHLSSDLRITCLLGRPSGKLLVIVTPKPASA
jgi:hypothetical protein